MFTPAEREALLAALVTKARQDPRVIAAALLGSGARDELDDWSDLDLALRLRPGADRDATAADWTTDLLASPGWTATLDLEASGALYRVFLLPSTLQVDLSFWPDAAFAPIGGPFRVIFGSAAPARTTVTRDPEDVVGWAWLYALHVRSALARGRRWQAAEMIMAMRTEVVALACARFGLPAREGRGVDRLPVELHDQLDRTLPRSARPTDLGDAFAATTHWLLAETEEHDHDLAGRLADPLAELVGTARPA